MNVNEQEQESSHETARRLAREICDRRGPETLAAQVERATSLIEQVLNALASARKDSDEVAS